MRIALDVTAALAGPSGVLVYIEELLAAFGRAGPAHHFTVYAPFWSRPERLASLRLPMAPNFRIIHKRVPQSLLLPADEFLGLGIQERWLSELGVEVFHGLGNIAPPLRRLPCVVTNHHIGGGVDVPGLWSRFYFGLLARRSVLRADAVIAVSRFSKEELVRTQGVPAAKVTAVLEGGPAPFFRPGSGGGARLVPEPYILYVGAFLERKNLATLGRAFALWRKGHPDSPHRLVLAGRRGRHHPVLERAFADAGVLDRVIWLEGPTRPDLVRLYQDAAAFVFPSLMEGFGFPVLEAMACGTPVIAARAGALPEVAGGAAILFDPLDVEGLSRAMELVLGDAACAADLRRKGLARVKEFSWDRAAQETLAVYKTVMLKSRR